MKQNGNYHKIKILLSVFIVSAIIALTGCSTLPTNIDGDFDSAGLPNHKYLVGGGIEIEWIASQPGTAYLVEESTKKIILTNSLDTEDELEFSVGSFDEDNIQNLFGTEVQNLKFSLYFIPADLTNED